MKALNTLQSNPELIAAIRLSGGGVNKQAIPEMIEWFRKIGYEVWIIPVNTQDACVPRCLESIYLTCFQPADFTPLNAIHIAGTKGKGSTSAIISSILAQYLPTSPRPGPSLRKIGLYTSPHLRFVRERIQINNTPLSEPAFTKYFFEVWDRLEDSARRAGLPADPSTMPLYFRFLTLVALHTYTRENVDGAVIECGIGGEYDSTNILLQPTVTGITSLGIDHTVMLGTTIEKIAWHKAGIMKSGSPAFTVPQPEEAMAVIQQRAEEKGVALTVVHRHPQLDTIKLGLAGDFQKTNASLAIAVAAAHLQALGHKDVSTNPLPKEFVQGLEQVRWAGRCETRREEGLVWYLDGGHTTESITVAGQWFASCVKDSISTSPRSSSISLPPSRVLIFNQQQRNPVPLLRVLHDVLASSLKTERPFSHVIFCSNVTFSTSGYTPDLVSLKTSSADIDDLSVQHTMAEGWRDLELEAAGEARERTEIRVMRTIEEAVGYAREVAKKWKLECEGKKGTNHSSGSTERTETLVFVTGSLHLVGGAIEVLETTRV